MLDLVGGGPTWQNKRKLNGHRKVADFMYGGLKKMMKDVHCKKESEEDRHANGFLLQKLPVKDLNCFEMTEVSVLSELSKSQCLIDSELEKLRDVLTSVDVSYSVERTPTSSSWNLLQAVAKDEWQKARPDHLDCLLSSRMVPERNCSYCSSPAILRCRDCMPEEWMCMECDVSRHKLVVLHNRDIIDA
ncbi:hypothetical protein MHYP_G00280240 [Metynnis hypsauchen]